MSVFNKDRKVNAFEVDSEDPIFLRPDEHTFLFFGASHSVVRMLAGKKENYTAGTINFKEVSLRPADLVGNRCSHSKKVVNEIHTACVGIHKNHVKYLFQESEFVDWFGKQDKEKLKPYRFVRPRKKTLYVQDSSFQIQINNGERVEEYTFEALSDIPYSSVATLASGQSRVEAGAPGGAGNLGSLVAAPSMVASADPGMSPEGVDTGWRGGGAGMTDVGAVAPGRPSGGAGMTMAGEAIVPGSGGDLAGLAAAPGAGGVDVGATQTVVVCPHCSQPIMFSFQAKKFGG
jgi:hypothetical protein